jgi:AraC-like DNA-binding protein
VAKAGQIRAGATRINDVRAARLREIQTYILDNLRQQSLSIRGVASRHGLSVAYVRELFAADGTTFRVSAAAAPRRRAYYAERCAVCRPRVGTIAFGVGFGSATCFDRVFKNRYGVKPAQLRERQRWTLLASLARSTMRTTSDMMRLSSKSFGV